MLVIKPYDRERAVAYARKWAFDQNPLFGNFRGIGGNCTNFVSQCLYAGSCRMNYRPIFGWYYISMDQRTASWSGVEYFYNFLVGNKGAGPFGEEVRPDEIEIGDVIQLGRNGEGFYHTLIVVGFEEDDPLIAAQTDDALNRPLSTYSYDFARYLKILGVRFEVPSTDDCFESVFNGIAIIPDERNPESPPQQIPPIQGGAEELPAPEGEQPPPEGEQTLPEGEQPPPET